MQLVKVISKEKEERKIKRLQNTELENEPWSGKIRRIVYYSEYSIISGPSSAIKNQLLQDAPPEMPLA